MSRWIRESRLGLLPLVALPRRCVVVVAGHPRRRDAMVVRVRVRAPSRQDGGLVRGRTAPANRSGETLQ